MKGLEKFLGLVGQYVDASTSVTTSHADGPMISPRMYREFSSPAMRALQRAKMPAQGNAALVGDIRSCLPDLIEAASTPSIRCRSVARAEAEV